MLTSLKIMLIISILLLPEYFILESPYRITNIVMIMAIFVYLIDKLVISREGLNISRDTKMILLCALAFLLYIYISDIIKNDPIEGAKRFFPNLSILLMLPIFEHNKSSLNLYKVFLVVFSVSVIFSFMQIGGLNANLNILLPGFGFIKSDQIINPAVHLYFRVCGATFSIIGFSFYLSITIIILYYFALKKNNVFLFVALPILIIVLFFTQTRSALYGIVPAIALTNLMLTKNTLKAIIKTIVAVVCIISVIYFFVDIIELKFPRIKNPFDASVIERLQTNYYATLGTWKEAPVFGVPRDEMWDVIRATAGKRGLVFGDTLRISGTHHNELLYYFRYYGLLGVGLLILLYYVVFLKILRTSNNTEKMILLSIFILAVLYSMAHNNKLINNILLWILLSNATMDEQPKENMINEPESV